MGPVTPGTPDSAIRRPVRGGHRAPEAGDGKQLAGQLVPRLADWSAQHESCYLYYPGRRQLPVPLKAFIAFARARRAGGPCRGVTANTHDTILSARNTSAIQRVCRIRSCKCRMENRL